jgi:hypothetical protein
VHAGRRPIATHAPACPRHRASDQRYLSAPASTRRALSPLSAAALWDPRRMGRRPPQARPRSSG